MSAEIRILNQDKIYLPVISGEIMLELERKGSPGKLSFDVVKDGVINFQEGNVVTLTVDGRILFYGYVFKKKRSKEQTISVTAYDQIRYLKNKDSICEENVTAAGLIRRIANDFLLECGELEEPDAVLPSVLADNETLLDIIQGALEETMEQTGDIYVLYDDKGKLTLKNCWSLRVEPLIDASSAEDLDYETSIDDQTYTRVRIIYDEEQSGEQMEQIPDEDSLEDDPKVRAWGVLQYFDTAETQAEAAQKAAIYYKLYNQKTRKLTVSGVMGNMDVRGGSLVPIDLNLGDIEAKTLMLVEKVKHVFRDNEHRMDVTLSGGEFVV